MNSNMHKTAQGQEREASATSRFTKVVLIVDSEEDVQAAEMDLAIEAIPFDPPHGRRFRNEHLVIVVNEVELEMADTPSPLKAVHRLCLACCEGSVFKVTQSCEVLSSMAIPRWSKSDRENDRRPGRATSLSVGG